MEQSYGEEKTTRQTWKCSVVGKRGVLFVTVMISCLSPSRPDIALLWFLTPFKAIKNLLCNQYRWLTIKIVTALLLLALFGVFLYNMPGYMVKKMLGA
jgi:hypothetical protein